MEKEIGNDKQIEMKVQGEGESHEPLGNGYFGIDRGQIDELITKYEQRKSDEELEFLASSLEGDHGVMAALKTNAGSGISEDANEIAERVKNFGENKLEEEELKNCCEFVWEALGDMMLQILIVAAIVQTVLGGTVGDDPSKDWIDGISIILAVVVVVAVGSITNYQKEKKFKQLNDTNSDMTKYIITRNGNTREVKADEILVGDIVNLGLGMIIPADALLISGTLKTDESTLTGESHLLEKESLQVCLKKKEDLINKGKFVQKKNLLPSPVIFSGTNACDGSAKCVVLAVGKYSVKGKIRETVKQSQEAEDSKTPLEEKLDDIAGQVGYFGLASAIITLVALFIQFGVKYVAMENSYRVSNQTAQFLKDFSNNYPDIIKNKTVNQTINKDLVEPVSQVATLILNIFLLCVAIVVVAIPEGLPLAVTLALAFSIKQMMKENNLVRKMQACETMGGANYICSDKTGTLTRNIMSVVEIFDGNENHQLEEITSNKENRVDPSKYFHNKDFYNIFRQAVLLNIDVTINETEEITKANKSDLGFVDLFHIFGESIYNWRKNYLGPEPRVIAFNSDRKRMSTFVKNSEYPTGYRLFIKGASDILLDMSKYYLDPSTNQPRILNDTEISTLKGTVQAFGKKTLRTIVVCYKDISAEDFENYKEADETGLVIVGVVGIRDTLRPGVPQAVEKCNEAGITVVMVTGDLKDTAVAIAQQCNIIPKELGSNFGLNVAMTGEEFYTRIGGLECETCEKKIEKCECPKTKAQAKQRGIDEDKLRKDRIANEEEFKKIAAEIRVIARCRPMDKYALVLGLKKMKNVVAVTGDGTNDAPALSKSDVGFAMGIQGTDIAKEASDIIILDDNFASIVTAVLWGRNIFDNIRKFIQFQLSVNLCACVLVFITACIGNETPLKPIQMLWVNLIMDSLGSLALATQPPDEVLLKRKPYHRSESIINHKMWKHIVIQALFSLAVLLFLYLDAPNFIVEDNDERIIENLKIMNCFGDYPGRWPEWNPEANNLTYYIIHGSASKWSSDKALNDTVAATMCSNYTGKADLSTAFKTYNSEMGATSHMTIVFNVFVFYTLFNQMNARIIDDNPNIFYRFFGNPWFIVITGIEMGLQVLLIEFGSNAFKVSKGGLSGSQWGICFGFAAITFPVSLMTKFLPLEPCIARFISMISGGGNKVGNSNDEAEGKDQSVHNNNQVQVLNVNEEANNQIKKETSSRRKSGIVNTIVKSRSKQLSKGGGSHQSLRKDKEN
jgi:P-type Ca2+ transporter type 2B